MKRVKILIVEDEAFALNFLAQKISKQNFDVVTAKDGDAAIEKFNKESPDMVLLDIGLPKLDGYGVLDYMRRQTPPEKWQPVVVISGYNKNTDINQNCCFEPDDYITKPCEVKVIIKKIENIAEKITEKRENFTEEFNFKISEN